MIRVAPKTDDNGNAMLQKKKRRNFKHTRHKISVPLAMSTNLHRKNSNSEEKMKKVFPGPMLGQDLPEKKSAQC